MKHLTICRHAKSSWTDLSKTDFERTLDSRGCSDALKMGEYLEKQTLQLDYLLSSSAQRAQETAEIIAKNLRFSGSINLEPRIYEASVAHLQEIIEELPEHKSKVMLFGHNPGLESLCNYISSGSIDALTTCNVVRYQLDIDHWKDFNLSCGKFVSLATPKSIRKT